MKAQNQGWVKNKVPVKLLQELLYKYRYLAKNKAVGVEISKIPFVFFSILFYLLGMVLLKFN